MNKNRTKHRGKSPLARPAFHITLGAAVVITLIVLLSRMATVYSDGGAYLKVEHGGANQNSSGTTGAQRPADKPAGYATIDTAKFPPGQCIHCHDEHASYKDVVQTTHTARDYLLFDTNTNLLCYVCHIDPITVGGTYTLNNRIWMGQTFYDTSSHGASANMRWPGANPPLRPAGEQNKCLNCHNPHGRTFTNAAENTTGQVTYLGTDPLPNMTFRLEERLCINCHDGSPATRNVNTQFAYAANIGGTGVYYNHPISRNAALDDRTPSVHTITETKPLGGANTARHVECADCHNPHYSGYGGTPLNNLHTNGSNQLSRVLLGVYGVQATYAGAWTAPAFTLVQLTSTVTNYEYELCFRCHSSYSTLPAFAAPNNVTDVSREFNPNNYAHHGVTAVGANQSVNANWIATFNCLNPAENPTTCPGGRWGKTSKVYCSDCHGDNAAAPVPAEGVHGASSAAFSAANPVTGKFILGTFIDVFNASAQRLICYKCHRRDVYGDDGYNPPNPTLSRMSHPANAGHTLGTRNGWGIWCMSCHGGATEGGIHGTNIGIVGPGLSPVGRHFMNGAAIAAFTEDAGGSNLQCWGKGVNDGVYVLNCTNHSGGRTTGFNYNY